MLLVYHVITYVVPWLFVSLSGLNLNQARKPAWIKRPRKMSPLNRIKHQILKRSFMRIFPMILPCKMMLFLRKGLSIPQSLLTSLPAPSGLIDPAVLQSLPINRPRQRKPASPGWWRCNYRRRSLWTRESCRFGQAYCERRFFCHEQRQMGCWSGNICCSECPRCSFWLLEPAIY